MIADLLNHESQYEFWFTGIISHTTGEKQAPFFQKRKIYNKVWHTAGEQINSQIKKYYKSL